MGKGQGQTTARMAEANAATVTEMPFADVADMTAVRRGFIGACKPRLVQDAAGAVVWDCDAYGFLSEPCPPTVNPEPAAAVCVGGRTRLVRGRAGSLPGQGSGPVEHVAGRGTAGVIVIDPLICAETAAAALALYRKHRGDRPVTGVVFTHSHVDHFGGVKGVTSQQEVDAGTCPILAPIGFLEHAIEENVYAGTAMGRPARPQRSARCRVDLRRGDPAILAKLTGLLDSNDPDFSIVTP